ncbi:MAG: UDP-N-acetylmuramoyl-L-alanyl-D-glutamate--2,6-diaminopimelate ligase [Chloroflexi bacterium SZAS-1]|nr:UDP-N-acetylmuramoyl-L-alanyl-D-glutamate--2,6-diaminopimelate ligase [Chloroflexi bacterium SZAS-1]
MQLRDILAGLPDVQVYDDYKTPITTLAYDSRAVQPGGLFVAISGFHTDGHAYIPQALARGAAAIVGERNPAELALPPGTAYVRVPNARTALAPIAAAYYGHPGGQMRVVGITGTDGKTTTTFLTSAVLEAGGHTTGMMGTVDFKVGARQWANDTRQSTPEAPEVQAMLREMVATGCDYAVLEATSHALSARWNRLGGAQFDVAVLTNVTHEHLDFHGSVEQYRRDKARLFEMLGEETSNKAAENDARKAHKLAIVNADDPHHQLFLDAAPHSATRLTYGIAQPADVRATAVQTSQHGLRFHVATPWGARDLNLRLTGDFNVANALAALTVGLAEGVPLDTAAAALEAIPGVRGRMERIEQGQPFTVLVDYAHTPGAFEKLMGIVRPLTSGQLIAVFGSAGERDREKRAIQGAVAARFCDFVVLTDEDPRLEDRAAIIAEIAAGVAANQIAAKPCDYLCIPDRPAAIQAAFARALPGDIVLLLGKGHEACIIYGTEKVPWDEAGAARAALHALGYQKG